MRYPGCSASWCFYGWNGIFVASLGFPLQLCCVKCSPTLTGILVLACLLYDSLPGVLVFGCAARCNGWSRQVTRFGSTIGNLVQQSEITTSEWKSTTVTLLRCAPTELLLCAPPAQTLQRQRIIATSEAKGNSWIKLISVSGNTKQSWESRRQQQHY